MTHAKAACRHYVVLLTLLAFVVAGCGSSTFTQEGGGPSSDAPSVTARQVRVSVSAPAATAPKEVRFATTITSTLRVRLQTSDGTDIVAPLTVEAPVPGSSVTVTFSTVPLTATRLVVEQLDGNGQVIVTQSSTIAVDAQSPNEINVTLNGPVVTLVVTPATATLAPKGSLTLRASGGSGAGFVWTLSRDASGGSVTASGLYTAGPKGNSSDIVTVTDSLGNTAEVTINVGPLVSISPATGNLVTGASLSLQANGGSGTGYVFTLSINASGATVTPSGVYTAGLRANTADVVTVTDSVGNTATAAISVSPVVTIIPAAGTVAPAGTLALTAGGGSDTGFTWTLSSNNSGGSVTASGLYTAGPTGTTVDVVTVTDSRGNSATATINVTAVVPVTSPPLLITPASSPVAPLGSQSLAASGGSGTGYLWTVSTNASGASVTAAGQYKAGSKPNTIDVVTLTDSLGNTATATLTVGAGVTVTPPTVTVTPREPLALTAAGGSGTDFVFTLTTDGSGASLTPAGFYTAGATGNTSDVVTVVDSLGNIATVTINVGPTVSITPSAQTVVRGGSVAFSASGGSGSGYTWAITTNGSGGTIDANSGAYVAGSTGGTTDVVTVTDSLLNSTTALVTIRPAPALASLSPSSGDVSGGNTITLNGTDFDQVAIVRVAGSSVIFTRLSSTQITITAPADPGSGIVSVGLDSDPGLSYGYDRTIPAGAHTLDTTSGLFDGASMAGLVNGTWNVGSFTLAAGSTITVTGAPALVINSTNNVVIDGSMIAAGGDGGNGTDSPGAGGSAGPGGFAGGGGGDTEGAHAGQGPGAGARGTVFGSGGTTDSSGGGGAGHLNAGTQVTGGAAAGSAYGPANDVPKVLVGGSGGGGGGRSPNNKSYGGGGGGGGGALRIIALNVLTLGATATLDVHGGRGGDGSNFGTRTSGASGGGGGSGGSVWLSAGVTATVDGAASILLSGGAGGLKWVGQPATFTATDGGAGSVGTLVVQP